MSALALRTHCYSWLERPGEAENRWELCSSNATRPAEKEATEKADALAGAPVFKKRTNGAKNVRRKTAGE